MLFLLNNKRNKIKKITDHIYISYKKTVRRAKPISKWLWYERHQKVNLSCVNVILSASSKHTLTKNSHEDLNKAFHTWPNICGKSTIQYSDFVPWELSTSCKTWKRKTVITMTGWVNYLLWVWIPLHALLQRSFKIVKGCRELQIYRK